MVIVLKARYHVLEKAFVYLCFDKYSFLRNSTKVIASSAFIEFRIDRICPKASFNISASCSSRFVSDKGSKIMVFGIGCYGKLNLQIG